MNEKLQKILEGVLQDENEASKFAELKTVDEMYSYFAEKVPGLSESDFDDFIVEMMEGYAENEEAIQNLDASSLEDVAGGASLGARFATGVLALLSSLPGAGALAANVKKPVNTSAHTSVSRKVSKAKVVKKAAPAVKKTKVIKAPVIQAPVVETPNTETPKVESPAVETPAVETPAVETPAVETPEIPNKYPKTKSWFRRHPFKTGILAIGTMVATYFAGKKMGWIGSSEVPKIDQLDVNRAGLIENTLRLSSLLTKELEIRPDLSPRDEIILYGNAREILDTLDLFKKQVEDTFKQVVKPEDWRTFTLCVNMVKDRCEEIISHTPQDVKNTDGKIEFLQQLIRSREAYQEAINPYSDATSWKTDRLIKEIKKLLKNKSTATQNLGGLRTLYTALKDKELSASDKNELTQIDAKIAVFRLGNLYGY